MVDEMKQIFDHTGTTKFKVPVDHIFVVDGLLTEPALVENIAQNSCRKNRVYLQRKNEPVPVAL